MWQKEYRSGMTHFGRCVKLLLLLLMISKAPAGEARPARGRPQSDLITGNEFLKLFDERDELHQEVPSSGFVGGAGSSVLNSGYTERHDGLSATKNTSTRSTSSRSLDFKQLGVGSQTVDKDVGKRVAKLVTTGSKIVFLEDNDESDDDALVNDVVGGIDIQKNFAVRKDKSQPQSQTQPQQLKGKEAQVKPNPSDEVKVVAVSVSSSSKRGSRRQSTSGSAASRFNKRGESGTTTSDEDRGTSKGQGRGAHPSIGRSSASKLQPTKPTTTSMPTTASPAPSSSSSSTSTSTTSPSTTTDFINRSHKSEFLIEEIEPMTMSKRKTRISAASVHKVATFDFFDVADSENSASTNIRNVLDAPLAHTTSTRSTAATAPVVAVVAPPPSAYHSSTRNSTAHGQTASRSSTYGSNRSGIADMSGTSPIQPQPSGVEDKFIQTVIYHDTKEGTRGPQSRSVSYSSISQNVEDFAKTWQQSRTLVDAQRNVNESLNPDLSIPHPPTDISEPAKFYSVPSKMYGLPAKFYSEPAKVYSEPAKVYSQPSRVYGEPAKTYWPQAATTTTTASLSTTTTTTRTPHTTVKSKTTSPTAPATAATMFMSRRPAIVSRIAFGEAQTTSTSTTTPVPIHYGQHSSTSAPESYKQPQQHQHHQHNHHQHHQYHNQQRTQAHRGQSSTQPRRILYNLDKLPYDLLNAPEPSSQYLLNPDLSESPPAAVTYSSPRQRTCLEAAFAASVSSTLSASQQQLQHQRQHSSVSDQHSNQNAKGLPNEDLVKCVSKYTNSFASAAAGTPPTAGGTAAIAVSSQHHQQQHQQQQQQQHQQQHHQQQEQEQHQHLPTESSRMKDLYTATPEQNYEIEESVSVMTNGQAHRVPGIGTVLATTTASPMTKTTRSRSRIRHNNGRVGVVGGPGGAGGAGRGTAAGGGGVRGSHYNPNANANVADGSAKDAGGADGDNGSYNYEDGDDDFGDGSKQEHSRNSGHGGGGDGGDDDEDSKLYYVVEGRNYRKYRVEEKTDDGFIVGEYGVVDHNDGNLRGVRYTADSTINPSLIQKALLTFLKLK